MKLPLIEVTWLDALTYTEMWALADVEERAQLTTRTTSGYLVAETKDGRTILAHTLDPKEEGDTEDFVSDVTVIPTGWIKSTKYIRGKPGKRRR